ncbi:polyprenyl synthetase family protein [Streptomyces sp. NPDC056652]|uniref:polyprenyl synthetase family protein n=1 Tax=Streptomyces sp. NPDC056652 TaxID=3345893 RepID=UPI0036AB78BC
MTLALAPGTTEAWDLLRRYRLLTGPRVRLAVDGLAEPVRTVALFHFGWCDENGRPADDGWGKGVRGALVLAAAQAVGGPADQALSSAAAVELVHNFSLLHDDVMDGDRMRRGRRTAWSVFGEAQAVLAGDALLALALDTLASAPPPPAVNSAATRELCRALLELVTGQGHDLAFERRGRVGLDECLAMAAGKTASLLAGACALGALSAGAAPHQVAGVRGFGHHLGLVFQLVDDLLGIWGDSRSTGKVTGGDLRRRKKSLPVVAALNSGSEAGRRLADLYGGAGPLDEDQVARAALLVEEAGGRDWAEREAARRWEHAVEQLSRAGLGAEAARGLLALAGLVTRRDR